MIETTVNAETLTGISLRPGTVVGYRENGRPIYNIAGGSVDVATDDDESDEDIDEDSDEEVEDEWVPPTKEQFDRILAEKKKADSEAAARKRLLRDAGLDPKTGKPVAKPKLSLDLDDEDDEDSEDEDVEPKKPNKGDGGARKNKAFERQLEREIAKTERRVRDEATVLMAAVPDALTEAGWNGRNLPRMLKLLDLDEIHVDSDGDVDGLNDQIAELKADFPEFFKRTRMREAAKEVADTKTVGGGRKKAPAAKEDQDWTSRLKSQLYGS
jgi:hypothetical protein